MYIHNKGKYFAFELVFVTFKTHHVQNVQPSQGLQNVSISFISLMQIWIWFLGWGWGVMHCTYLFFYRVKTRTICRCQDIYCNLF